MGKPILRNVLSIPLCCVGTVQACLTMPARRMIIGIELAQKIRKRQFAIPITWQSNPAVIWSHVN